MSIENEFPTVEAMEQVVITAMGVREGVTQAVGQIDAILAGPHGPRRRRLGPRVPRRDRRRRRRVTPACSSRRPSSGAELERYPTVSTGTSTSSTSGGSATASALRV
jgi:hypothetical protein